MSKRKKNKKSKVQAELPVEEMQEEMDTLANAEPEQLAISMEEATAEAVENPVESVA